MRSLIRKTPVTMPENMDSLEERKVMWNDDVIVMRTKRTYISVLQGEDTLLGEIIGMLVDLRTNAKTEASRHTVRGIDWRRWTVLGPVLQGPAGQRLRRHRRQAQHTLVEGVCGRR